MANFSISELGNLTPSEPVDLPVVERRARKSTFPTAGFYTLRIPELDPEFTFGQTSAGFLSAEVNPTIVGGDYDGYEVRFQKLSAKTFPEQIRDAEGNVTGTRKTSQIARYLQSAGYSGSVPGEPEKLAELVLATGGTEVRAILDWRAFNKRTKDEVVGMENFPKFDDGGIKKWIEDPDDMVPSNKDPEVMIPRRYPARIFVKRWLTR